MSDDGGIDVVAALVALPKWLVLFAINATGYYVAGRAITRWIGWQ